MGIGDMAGNVGLVADGDSQARRLLLVCTTSRDRWGDKGDEFYEKGNRPACKRRRSG
jgi:hypothetical protein